MKRIIFLLLTIVLSSELNAAIKYYSNMFGNVVRNASNYSASLTTISCGHPVKVVEGEQSNSRWSYVKVGAYQGYLPTRDLVAKKPYCFQDRYPRFFEQFDLDLAEYYYWGKLYNQYVQGKSRVR